MSVKLSRNQEVPSCNKCLVSLMGRQYLVGQNSRKFCVECYEALFCNTCHTCGSIIATGSRDISYKDLHFHDGCFTCAGCSKSLSGERFIHKENQFICERCYENKFSPKCSNCKKPFRPGVKRMEYEGLSYHEKCFCCSSCSDVIGKKSFVKKDDGIFCESCFESRLADKCAKCKKVIKSSGVSYKEETYHSGCFVCGACAKELAGEQFVTHDKTPYCIDCHTSKFAKKCLKCNQPISGIGETKMIAFEDFSWHLGCFKCEKCKMALENKGFVMHEEDTYCEDCAEEL
ncbi:four and a half LIM domains protein 2-like [Clavelina lepadiformis]|uniref:LIM zinc-binding domain-containing protein n=1 Tax=Clavelina lepadiformis TaxID=159417 RepID=A0ABP0G995_CLALP